MKKLYKKAASDFIKTHSLTEINYRTLSDAASKLGYTVIEFGALSNEGDVATVIDELNLNSLVAKSRGFTYTDENFRLIFINEDLTDDEKALVLSHELGHIVLGHASTPVVIGNDVCEEHGANEFSHYLLNQKLRLFLTAHKKPLIAGGVFALLVVFVLSGFFLYEKEASYYGDFYVTTSGSKYHKAQCIHVKDKSTVSRLSVEDFENGLYTPCDMCLPE